MAVPLLTSSSTPLAKCQSSRETFDARQIIIIITIKQICSLPGHGYATVTTMRLRPIAYATISTRYTTDKKTFMSISFHIMPVDKAISRLLYNFLSISCAYFKYYEKKNK